jgi:CRP/FNR family cyclic AMP-dependent transcriptional regulator
MIERFEGSSGHKAFFEAMRAQQCVCHNDDAANALCAAATLSELQPGDALIQVGGHDNDIYFILSGRVSILVKGRELALRKAEQHVGEIAMIDRSSTRSATVLALESTVVAKVSEPNGTRIALILFTEPTSGGGSWFLQ